MAVAPRGGRVTQIEPVPGRGTELRAHFVPNQLKGIVAGGLPGLVNGSTGAGGPEVGCMGKASQIYIYVFYWASARSTCFINKGTSSEKKVGRGLCVGEPQVHPRDMVRSHG